MTTDHLSPAEEREYADLCGCFEILYDAGMPEKFGPHVQESFGLTEAESLEWVAQFTKNYETFLAKQKGD